MDGSRIRVALLLLLVFGAGVAGGVALERLWLDRGHDRDDHRGTVIQRHADELDLTDRQRARVDSIVSRFRERMKAVWSEVEPRIHGLADSARGEIEAVLEPGQVERYRELLERERKRDRDDADRGKDRPGGGPEGERPESSPDHRSDSMTRDAEESS